MQYGNMNVDEKYSKIVEPNLYADSVLKPGETYTDEFQGDADCGLVKVYKQGNDGIVTPGTPAGDFSDENISNTLIDVRLNNAFRKSKKIYKVTEKSVTYPVAETTLANALQDCKLGWQTAGLACLAKEGTVIVDGATLTKSNIKSKVIAIRKELRNAGAVPDVCIVSTDVYAIMLEAAGDTYTPVYNDEVNKSGQVGRWLGLLWIEANLLNNAVAKYYDHAGDLQTVDLTKVDILMYDHTTLAIVDNLEEIRIVDTDEFVGVKAQVEFNSGYRVRNSARVAIKKNNPVTIDFAKGNDSATGTAPTSISAAPGSYVTLPANTFSLTGKAFDGWSNDSGTHKLAAGTKVLVSEATTYAACWKDA